MSIFKNLISVVPLCQYDKITLLSACAFYLPRNFVRQSASNRTKVSPRRVKRDTYEFQVRASLPAHLSDSPVFEAIVSSILEHASYRSRKYLIDQREGVPRKPLPTAIGRNDKAPAEAGTTRWRA